MLKDHEEIITSLSWVELLLAISGKARRGLRKKCLDGIRFFKKGKPSEQGDECVRFLKEDCTFIGYAVNICYVMEQGESKTEEETIWIHPFSVPSPLYKVKGVPLMVVGNENLDYNKNVLNNIPANKYNEELRDFITNVRGIQG
jgi:hypothetical protein